MEKRSKGNERQRSPKLYGNASGIVPVGCKRSSAVAVNPELGLVLDLARFHDQRAQLTVFLQDVNLAGTS